MTPTSSGKIPVRERDAVIRSLRAGVVPRAGLNLIQVGRSAEVGVMKGDLDRIAEGGTSFRLISGDFGAGKSFFLNLIEVVAQQMKMVTVRADLTPSLRLHSTKGDARGLYAALVANMATRSSPDGRALNVVVERFVSTAFEESQESGVSVDSIIQSRLVALEDMPFGYEFSQAIRAYWRGHESEDAQVTAAAMRWLRGEYATKTEARAAGISMREIIDDSNYYDCLKVLAAFVRLAGYAGMLVCIDEVATLYRISNKISRNYNYDQILRILNDCLQGTVEGIGFILGTTTETIDDPNRGLFSYQALRSRLAGNTFAKNGLVDYSGPVLTLPSLTAAELFVLLEKISNVYAGGIPENVLVPEEALRAFLEHCQKNIGDDFFRTPRKTIKEFVGLLAVLEQNPGAKWSDLIEEVEITPEEDPNLQPLDDEQDTAKADNELTRFRL